jgi:hypothetical protein
LWKYGSSLSQSPAPYEERDEQERFQTDAGAINPDHVVEFSYEPRSSKNWRLIKATQRGSGLKPHAYKVDWFYKRDIHGPQNHAK